MMTSAVPFDTRDLARITLSDGINEVAGEVAFWVSCADRCVDLNNAEAAAFRREKAMRMAKLVKLAEAVLPVEDEVKSLLASHQQAAKAAEDEARAEEDKGRERRRHYAKKRATENTQIKAAVED